MLIAIAQTDIKFEDTEYNIASAKRLALEASDKGSDIILFPEMSFTGFSMNASKICDQSGAIDEISALCRDNRIAIGFGWVERKDHCKNHYTVIDKDGVVVSDYVKIHPFSAGGEAGLFIGGDEITCFTIENVVFSSFICYDLRFPELFRIASKKADVIIVPANWPNSRIDHWNCLIQARAIENQVYVIGINCFGMQDNIYYSGGSRVVNPNGQVVLESNGEEALLYYDLLNDVDEFRKAFPVQNDRREELYIEILGDGSRWKSM